MRRSFFAYFLLLFTIACGSNSASEEGQKTAKTVSDCKFGAPTSIFSPELPIIASHQFKLNGQKGMEQIKFVNGDQLDLLQDGCNEIRQEFRFFISQGPFPASDSLWIETAVKKLGYLSGASEKHLIFSMWAGAIDALKTQISMGQAIEPEKGIFITVDRLQEEQMATLIILLERKS